MKLNSDPHSEGAGLMIHCKNYCLYAVRLTLSSFEGRKDELFFFFRATLLKWPLFYFRRIDFVSPRYPLFICILLLLFRGGAKRERRGELLKFLLNISCRG